VDIVESHLLEYPARRKARFETFYFCEAHEVTVPFGPPVSTLEGLAAAIRLLGHQSLHYHFINSRLRLQLRTTISRTGFGEFSFAGGGGALGSHRFL